MIGVISDIHGNFPALKAVLMDMPPVEMILCAGDVVGYYPYPNEVIKQLQFVDARCILGNHDRAVLGEDYSNFNRYAAAAVRWTIDNLDEESMAYLKSLSNYMRWKISGKKVAVHHGAPFDEDFYVMPENVDSGLLEYDGADILILGHTHVPFIVDYGDKAILNPGAVGQPRDGNPKASYALIDLENWKFEIRRVQYPVEEVEKKIIDVGLPHFLAERLYYGY